MMTSTLEDGWPSSVGEYIYIYIFVILYICRPSGSVHLRNFLNHPSFDNMVCIYIYFILQFMESCNTVCCMCI